MEKRLLGMLLCCIMMIGMLPVSAAAASEERTCTLTADDSNATCGWLTGKIKVSTIDTVPFIGTDSTGTYSLYTADAGVTMTVAEDLVGSDYRYTYSACLIRRDFADDGSVDWTHLEDYEGNPQVFTAADGAVKLPDGAYCLEINCEKTPLIAPAGSAASYTPVRVFLRVGLGKNIVNPFTDVPAGSYFCTPVLWAVDKGITSGTSASTFSPVPAAKSLPSSIAPLDVPSRRRKQRSSMYLPLPTITWLSSGLPKTECLRVTTSSRTPPVPARWPLISCGRPMEAPDVRSAFPLLISTPTRRRLSHGPSSLASPRVHPKAPSLQTMPAPAARSSPFSSVHCLPIITNSI